jgi:hypothetical protein
LKKRKELLFLFYKFLPDKFHMTPPQKSPSRLNREWHLANRMPPKATPEQRALWHIDHAKHCACRKMPDNIKKLIKEY